MTKYSFLDMKRLTAPYATELKEACSAVIDSGRFLNGSQTRALEDELCAMHGVEHCVAVSNGLDALRLILRGWVLTGKLHEGDEVLVAANTYVASVLAITDSGLTPVLVEPEPITMNMDPQAAEAAVTPRTRVIMEVHLYGTPTRHAPLAELARRHGLLIMEDNAQAIGAAIGGQMTGTLGDAAAFSFYPTKNVGALGDAGAVLTPHADLADAVRALANYGSDTRYHNIYQGFNCRMDEIQAAMLRVKLRHLEAETRRRQQAALVYSDKITDPLVQTPATLPECRQVWHQYVVRTPHREELRRYLEERGVQTDIHYATPPHRQPCYADRWEGLQLPFTELLADEVMSLPIATVSPGQAAEIARIINTFK